jgi:hypothetical protein
MVISDIEADLLEYADFEGVGSVARAQLFVTAAKRWLILRPESASNQSSSLSIGKSSVQDMLERANNFIAARSRGGTRFLSVRDGFR